MSEAESEPTASAPPHIAVRAVALLKPRVVAANAAMIVVGAAAAGALAAPRLLPALVGGGLVIASAAAANQWYERDADARMTRTCGRPLAAGDLPAWSGPLTAAVFLVAGLAVLLGFTTRQAAAWATVGWVLYTLVYTPAKRSTPASLHVGALSGAVTPLLGAYAVASKPGAAPWAIALFILIWQYPHFLAIGIRRADDYRASGLAVFTVRHRVSTSVALARATATALVIVGPIVTAGGAVAVWTVAAMPLALVAWRPWKHRTDDWARELFFASLWSILLMTTGVIVLAAVGS